MKKFHWSILLCLKASKRNKNFAEFYSFCVGDDVFVQALDFSDASVGEEEAKMMNQLESILAFFRI